MSEWDGKVAIVTGGSRGIGRASSEALARLGVAVLLTGRDSGRAQETAREISLETGASVTGIAMDVTDRQAVEGSFKALYEEHRRIDILVNNAGITRDNLLLRMKPEEWESVMATNVNGLYYCSQAVLRPMIRQRSGRIVNISSVVGLMGNSGQTNYAASKAAILGFTKSLAREVASRNITVNAVAPGFIETDMTRALSYDQKALGDDIPLGRVGQPAEVAAAVVFLASQGAGYITGEVLQVNGGLYM